MALLDEFVWKSRMTGDCHVRFCEKLGGKFPGLTRLVPRGTYNDGGRPTVAASKVEATNNQCLLFSRKMGVVVSVTGKGEN